MKQLDTRIEIHDPDWFRWLTARPNAGWLWLPLRLWLGWQWLKMGRQMVADERWTGSGTAIRSLWQQALNGPETGQGQIAFDWYRATVQGLLAADAHLWLAGVAAWGEVLVGIAVLVGALTGIFALCGALLNIALLTDGSAFSSPTLFFVAIGLTLSWKVSGQVGLDRWLLPLVGAPLVRARQHPRLPHHGVG